MSLDDTPDLPPCRYCDAPVCARHCGVCGAEGQRREGYDFPVCDLHGAGVAHVPDDGGALGWAFRPPSRVESVHRDSPITLDGRQHWQQDQAVHCKGAGYKSATVRTVRREIGEEQAARINRALDALTPAQRDVMRLKLAGQKHADIAAELGIAEVTVDERARRGKAAMKRQAR